MANDIRKSQKEIRESGFDAFLRELKPGYTGLEEAHSKLSGRLDQQKSAADLSPQKDVPRKPESIFAQFNDIGKQTPASLTRSEIDSKRDLFAEFGFDPLDMLVKPKRGPQIKDSMDLDFWTAFDEFTDEGLYSRFHTVGPNCMAYAYGMPKEADGSKFRDKPEPGYFAGADSSGELQNVMIYGTPEHIKDTFEKYMKMDMDALGKQLVEVDHGNYQPKKGERMFALVTSPEIPGFGGADFHYYVKDNNGFWSHKPGVTDPTIFDDSGKTIKDPANCDRGIYHNFVGYYVMKDKGAL